MAHDIERFSTVRVRARCLDVEETMKDEYVVGEVKISYRNQPVWCRECDLHHVNGCPERQRRFKLEKEQETLRQKDVHTIIVGDSNLRYANQSGTNANIKSSTGAKIGQALNLLAFQDIEKYQNIILSVGQNNISPDPEENIEIWEAAQQVQLDNFSLTVRQLGDLGKTVTVMDIPFFFYHFN